MYMIIQEAYFIMILIITDSILAVRGSLCFGNGPKVYLSEAAAQTRSK